MFQISEKDLEQVVAYLGEIPTKYGAALIQFLKAKATPVAEESDVESSGSSTD